MQLRDHPLADPTGHRSSSAAIAAVIGALSSTDGAVVELGPGTFLVDSPIVIPAGVVLRGDGHGATKIVLDAGKNCDVIQSDGFGSLTGTGKWSVSDGVPWGFGVQRLTVDGNVSGPNTSGNGISFYGKNYRVHDVVVTNCAKKGFYSECGHSLGSTTYIDVGQSSIVDMLCFGNGDDGIYMAGPHDSVFDRIVSCSNGALGMAVVVDTLHTPANFDGTCVINNIHTFQNTTGGFSANTPIRSSGVMIFEDPAMFAGDNNLINSVKIALGSQANDQLVISGESSIFGSVWGLLHDPGGSLVQNGVRITGDYTQIGDIHIDGHSLGGTGVIVDANNVRIGGGNLLDFSATGGRALQIAPNAALNQLDIDLTVYDSDYNVLLSHSVYGSRLKIRSYSASVHHVDPAGVLWDTESNDLNIWGGPTGGTTDYMVTKQGWPGKSADLVPSIVAGVVTITDAITPNDLLFDSAITAAVSLVLPTASVQNKGFRRRVIRSASATGAFNVTVNPGTIKNLSSAGTWVDVESNGSVLRNVGSGTL